MYNDATTEEINDVMLAAWGAFHKYRNLTLKQRADFMRAIASELQSQEEKLLALAAEETHLEEARLKNELIRTIFQLNSYAEACESGDWLEIRIDTAVTRRKPPRPDLRKMLVPLGPVVVFGAANFPFAYSTAGGDTACALAAGCPVVVKGHPSHPGTSELVARSIMKAATDQHMPAGVFAHVHGRANEVGEALVNHRYAKAVGFTGSVAGGRQLFDWASQRKEPIPVFAEMSSVNPVFFLPGKIKDSTSDIAKMFANSITLGVGQFCTNPGLMIGIDNSDMENFISVLSEEIKNASPGEMLHTGIFKNYVEKRANAIAQDEVNVVAVSAAEPVMNQGLPTIATATAQAFINNPVLHQEVFGPFSLIILCKDMNEMIEVAKNMEGQLTTTIVANEEDLRFHDDLIDSLKNICGRLILNGVPTGVEVVQSMHHGGPYPATTDSRFTSVGSDGIKRFARPVCFQNWGNAFLPAELRNENPSRIWRVVNGKYSKNPVK